MSLKETINNDIKTAMKAKDKETLAVLRMIKTAIQAAEIDKKSELTPEEELTILSREAKQRRDSIVEFEKANRPELVEKTQGELVIVEKYLPAQLSLEEVQAKITGYGNISIFGNPPQRDTNIKGSGKIEFL